MEKQPSQEGLNIYTIFDKPLDFPEHFVCRKFVVDSTGAVIPEQNILYKSKSLENIQFTLSNMGLFNIGREPLDDIKIVESWI